MRLDYDRDTDSRLDQAMFIVIRQFAVTSRWAYFLRTAIGPIIRNIFQGLSPPILRGSMMTVKLSTQTVV